MRTVYRVVLIFLSIVVLSWFLPWLYTLMLPSGVSDPFVAYSPISGSFIVSSHGDDGELRIVEVDSNGVNTGNVFTREERDSLLPHIYFSQLVARQQLPDTVCGKPITVHDLKRSQWVFNSSPRDHNRVKPGVNLMMESMPARFDLEDPKEGFRLDGKVEFIEMSTNAVNETRSRRFTDMFASQGFAYPVKDMSANITTRKPYDEGYLMVDAEGAVYHVKMQAGRPYMTRVNADSGIRASNVFILENADTRYLGIVADEAGCLYALEHDGYRLIHLPVGRINPKNDKFSIMKNMFNWVVKVNTDSTVYWTAIASDDYRLLGNYSFTHSASAVQKIGGYIFPFELSFTSVKDCLAYPRIENVSWRALPFNFLLAVLLPVAMRRKSAVRRIIASLLTAVFGIFAFIPFILIKD